MPTCAVEARFANSTLIIDTPISLNFAGWLRVSLSEESECGAHSETMPVQGRPGVGCQLPMLGEKTTPVTINCGDLGCCNDLSAKSVQLFVGSLQHVEVQRSNPIAIKMSPVYPIDNCTYHPPV